MSKVSKHTVFLLLSLLLSIFGGIIIAYMMKWGPWAYNDSAAYVSMARNLYKGIGPVIVHSTGKISDVREFPVFYPLLLSIMSFGESNLIGTIRILNTILFSFSIILVSQLIYHVTNNHLISILGAAFFASSKNILTTFSSAMSEPLFISLVLTSYLQIFLYLRFKKELFLFLFTIFSSLFPITRYAGIIVVVTFGISAFLLIKKKNLYSRILLLLKYYVISFTPVLGLMVYRYIKDNKLGGKRFKFSSLTFRAIFESVKKQLNIIADWIPYYTNYKNSIVGEGIIYLCLILIFISLFILLLKRKIDSEKLIINKSVILSLGLIFTGYTCFIAVIYVTSSPQIDIIDRMLIPMFPFLLLFLCVLFSNILTKGFIKFSGILITLLFLIAIRFNTLVSTPFVREMNEIGRGFTQKEYVQSDFLDEILSLPENRLLVSNTAGFTLLHKNIYPIQISQFHHRPYGSGDSYGEKLFRTKDGILVILYSDFYNYYGPDSKQLLEFITANLSLVFSDDVGGIYSLKN